MHLNPYLNFNGQCEAAFKFYAECLGGKIIAMNTYGGTPAEGEVPSDWGKKILHGRIAWGENLLMGGDELPEDYEAPKGFNVTINIEDAAEAERIFSTLAKDGTIRMPLQETFWATRFGMLTDQFGTPWMINCEKRS
ncbi:MAG: glyoxalase/bleomycin resistance/extradiol dioxygenase family protein [Chthoniobacterales bacterium]